MNTRQVSESEAANIAAVVAQERPQWDVNQILQWEAPLLERCVSSGMISRAELVASVTRAVEAARSTLDVTGGVIRLEVSDVEREHMENETREKRQLERRIAAQDAVERRASTKPLRGAPKVLDISDRY